MFYLLDRITLPALVTGITISPVQAGLAQTQAEKEHNRISPGFIVADFQTVPLSSKSFDLAYSIEAFVHAPHPARYFAETARLLRPGGRLVLIDDVLSENAAPETEPHRLWLDAYRQGWRLPGLRTASWIAAEAARHGLIKVRDRSLSAWLRLRTIPNWAAKFLLKNGFKLPLRHAIWGSLLGSLALQHCLKAGLVEYHLLVFERQA